MLISTDTIMLEKDETMKWDIRELHEPDFFCKNTWKLMWCKNYRTGEIASKESLILYIQHNMLSNTGALSVWTSMSEQS